MLYLISCHQPNKHLFKTTHLIPTQVSTHPSIASIHPLKPHNPIIHPSTYLLHMLYLSIDSIHLLPPSSTPTHITHPIYPPNPPAQPIHPIHPLQLPINSSCSTSLSNPPIPPIHPIYQTHLPINSTYSTQSTPTPPNPPTHQIQPLFLPIQSLQYTNLNVSRLTSGTCRRAAVSSTQGFGPDFLIT